MNLSDLTKKYINYGYNEADAFSKVCQDIILLKIGSSKFKDNITVKGGVVMHSISKDVRRATRDIDIDFIKYSLDDSAIINFIDVLNQKNDGVNIKIIDITKLHHQDYDGKRVNVELLDNYGNIMRSKLDIGVHKYFDIAQDDYYFDLNIIGDGVNLLINSKEQIFVEKLKSLLKFGISSTRYKDIFDFYYLIFNCKLDEVKLLIYINILIFDDDFMEEKSIKDIIDVMHSIFHNVRYRKMLSLTNNNWLGLSVDKVIDGIMHFFGRLKEMVAYN